MRRHNTGRICRNLGLRVQDVGPPRPFALITRIATNAFGVIRKAHKVVALLGRLEIVRCKTLGRKLRNVRIGEKDLCREVLVPRQGRVIKLVRGIEIRDCQRNRVTPNKARGGRLLQTVCQAHGRHILGCPIGRSRHGQFLRACLVIELSEKVQIQAIKVDQIEIVILDQGRAIGDICRTQVEATCINGIECHRLILCQGLRIEIVQIRRPEQRIDLQVGQDLFLNKVLREQFLLNLNGSRACDDGQRKLKGPAQKVQNRRGRAHTLSRRSQLCLLACDNRHFETRVLRVWSVRIERSTRTEVLIHVEDTRDLALAIERHRCTRQNDTIVDRHRQNLDTRDAKSLENVIPEIAECPHEVLGRTSKASEACFIVSHRIRKDDSLQRSPIVLECNVVGIHKLCHRLLPRRLLNLRPRKIKDLILRIIVHQVAVDENIHLGLHQNDWFVGLIGGNVPFVSGAFRMCIGKVNAVAVGVLRTLGLRTQEICVFGKPNCDLIRLKRTVIGH